MNTNTSVRIRVLFTSSRLHKTNLVGWNKESLIKDFHEKARVGRSQDKE